MASFPKDMSIAQRVFVTIKFTDPNKGITRNALIRKIGGEVHRKAAESALRRMYNVEAAVPDSKDRWYPTNKTEAYHKGKAWKAKPNRKSKTVSVDVIQNLLDAMAAAESELIRLQNLDKHLKDQYGN